MTSWRRTAEGEREKAGGRTGVRHTSQPPTELVGRRVLRPYVPHGMKRIGEGEGDDVTSHVSYAPP